MDETAPRCQVCHRPMSRELARTLGWKDHPGCDQEYTDQVRRLATAAGRTAINDTTRKKK